MSGILRTEDLSKRFGRTPVLDRVTLDVTEGSVYALVGPNGAGKTTIKILMNIIEPTAGRAEVRAGSRHLRRNTSRRSVMCPENHSPTDDPRVFPHLSPSIRPGTKGGRACSISSACPFSQAKHLSCEVHESGPGLVLAYRPRLLVLDEPFTA
jgi:ABC-2 type transport system ATP-binding protein